MPARLFQRWRGWGLGALLASALAGCGDHQAAALKKLSDKGYSLSVPEFVRAAKMGDEQAVRWFVEAGVVPTLPDTQHHTALGEAVAAGQLPVVAALVDLGVPLPVEGEAGATLLDAAVQSRSLEVLKFLLAHQVTGKGMKTPGVESPLSVAARLGQREALSLLLPDSSGAERQEALFAGATGGDVAVLSLLIRAGTSVLERQPRSGRTALLLAAASQKTAAAELLLNAGSNRWAVDEGGEMALDVATEPALTTLLKAPPTEEDKETAARSLDGANLEVNRVMNESLEALFHLRGCREETLPVMLESAEGSQAVLRAGSGAAAKTVAAGSAIAGTGWVLQKVRGARENAADWYLPLAILRLKGHGPAVALVKGLPARCGRPVAVLEFGAAHEICEGVAGQVFTVQGTTPRRYQIDQVAPLSVTFHDLASPGKALILRTVGLSGGGGFAPK